MLFEVALITGPDTPDMRSNCIYVGESAHYRSLHYWIFEGAAEFLTDPTTVIEEAVVGSIGGLSQYELVDLRELTFDKFTASMVARNRAEEQTDLLMRVARLIENEPSAYDQGGWGHRVGTARTPCGTIACIAGHIAVMAGGVYIKGDSVWLNVGGFNKERPVFELAREAAGFTEAEADHLFDTRWKPTGWDTTPTDMDGGWSRQQLAMLVGSDLRAIANGADPIERGGLFDD